MNENPTPNHDNHRKAAADFGGRDVRQMPRKNTIEFAEHHALRDAAVLFDLSHMGGVWVTGPDSADFLNYAMDVELSALPIGRSRYALMYDKNGDIIDALISHRRAEDAFFLVPNEGNANAVVQVLAQRAASFNVAVQDVGEITALIAIQGPKAGAVLVNLVPSRQHPLVTELQYYASVEVEIDGQDVLLARTSYTGRDGFEIYAPKEDAAGIWEALVESGSIHGLIAAGTTAAI